MTGDQSMVPDALNSILVMKSSQQNSYVCEREIPSFALDEIQSPQRNANNVTPVRKCNFPTVEIQTPLELQDSSFNEDCLLNSRGKSESVEQKCKFKRLRKLGDLNKDSDCKRKKNGKGKKLQYIICYYLYQIVSVKQENLCVFWNSFD